LRHSSIHNKSSHRY